MNTLNFFAKHLISASRRKRPAVNEIIRPSSSKTVQRAVSEAAVKFFSQQEKTKKEILSQKIGSIEKRFEQLRQKGYSGDRIKAIAERLKALKARI